MTLANSDYYPISLSNIRQIINRKKCKIENRQNLLLLDFQFSDENPLNVKEEVNRYGEKMTRVDGEIPENLSIKNGQSFLFISYDQSKYSHGFHKYPAKFFPELPRWFIKKYSRENDIVLDPFCGSGTTLIESQLNNRHSVGIDVDPFSRFLSKVKTTPLNVDELNYFSDMLIKQIVSFVPSCVKFEDIPEFPYRDNWFNEEIIQELTFILKNINNLSCSVDLKNYYKICFSSIIRTVSNADDNCTRTVIRKKLNKKVYPSMALTKFVEALLLNDYRMKDYSAVCPENISVEIPENNDARDLKYCDGYFDLAVTSPPYVNAVDYPRTHQLEIYWLGVEQGSLTPLKRKHIGTESVLAKDYRLLHKTGIKEADNKISKIYEKDPRRAYIAFKFLSDMRDNLVETYRTLKKDGYYIIVIGNNTIRGQNFESWKYIIDIAKEVGFELENHIASEIIRHFIKVPRDERINTDWILILKK